MKLLKLSVVALCIVGVSACVPHTPILTEDQLKESLVKCDKNGGLEKVWVDTVNEKISTYRCKDGATFYD